LSSTRCLNITGGACGELLRDKRPVFRIHHIVTIGISSLAKARLTMLCAKRRLDQGEVVTVDFPIAIEVGEEWPSLQLLVD
jgi:hypothetical protein